MRRKFGNQPTVRNGIHFASKKEAERYSVLKILEMSGRIAELECQPSFDIVVNGTKVCRYVADFRYIENGQTIVEDVKSEPTKTSSYRLKKKLMLAVHGISIAEV